MANKKSLQQGGAPEVRNNLEYLLSELQDKIQNQNIPVQQSVADLVSEGNNPQEIAQALMQIGYKEADIKQIFSALPTAEENSEVDKQAQQQPQQEEEVAQEQVQQQKIQQMQQEGATAKKGAQVRSSMNNMPKAQKGKSFKDWMGSINQSEMYQNPEARYLPMKKSNSSLDAITGLASNIGDFIDTTKTWDDNKEDFYKYKVNYGEGVDPSDYATNARELFRSASKKKGLRTKDELRDLSKKESRVYYDPQKGYSFDISDPYSTEAQRHKMRQKEMGVGYKKRSIPINDFQGFDYDQSQAINDYLYNKQSGNLPSGTTLGMDEQGYPTYVSGQSTNYPIMFGQKKFNTTQQNVDAGMNDLYNRKGATLDWGKEEMPNIEYGNTQQRKPYWNGSYWEGAHAGSRGTKGFGWNNRVKQLGGNTPSMADFMYQVGGEPLDKKQWYNQNPKIHYKTASEIDALYQEYSSGFINTIDPNFTFGDHEKENENVNIQQPDATVQQPTASFKNKGWGDFQRGMSKFGDVSEFAVNAGRNINTFLENAEYNKTLGDVEYGQGADSIYGIENPNKGYWTYQQEGILQPNMQTEYMSQRGREMKKYQSGAEKYEANELGIFDVRSDWFNSLSLDKQRQVADHNKQILINTGTSVPTRTGPTSGTTSGSSPSRVEVIRTNKATSSNAIPDPVYNTSDIDFKKWYDTNMKTKDIISPFGGRKYSQEEIDDLEMYQTGSEKKPLFYTDDKYLLSKGRDSSTYRDIYEKKLDLFGEMSSKDAVGKTVTTPSSVNPFILTDANKALNQKWDFDTKMFADLYGGNRGNPLTQEEWEKTNSDKKALELINYYKSKGIPDSQIHYSTLSPFTGSGMKGMSATGSYFDKQGNLSPVYPDPHYKYERKTPRTIHEYMKREVPDEDRSKEGRKKLAEELGIENYDFSEEKNTELLEKYKAFREKPVVEEEAEIINPAVRTRRELPRIYNFSESRFKEYNKAKDKDAYKKNIENKIRFGSGMPLIKGQYGGGFHNQPMIRAQIGVESELDPKYKSYQDSMNLYDAMLMQDKLMGSNKDGRYFDIPNMDWSTDVLKQGRKQKYSTIFKKYMSTDWQNQQEMEAEISDSKYGPKQEDIDLINYYKQLGFTDDDIMYHTSPDLATDKIKAVGTYWDGKAFSPKFKKPEQEVIPTNTLYGYMKVQGIDPSFDSRKKMADMYGIKNYSGTQKQNEQLRELIKNTQEGPRAQQGYEMYRQGGGFTNPFEEKSKRQLRRKKGGQVANVSTEILKKLQAKGAKFNIL